MDLPSHPPFTPSHTPNPPSPLTIRYAKSEALAYSDFELRKYPHAPATHMSRCGVGVRHEGSLLLGSELHLLGDRVFDFVDTEMAKAPNVLRDSVYARGQAIPFHVDVHVRAIMLHKVWDEYRARGNLKGGDERTLGPLGVAEHNDQVWKVGTMLRSADDDEVLRILHPDYTPFTPDPRLDEWRARRDARTVPTVDGKGQVNYRAAMGDQIQNSGRGDWGNYKPLLLRFLRLFGEGIHESLMRTCWDQLSHLSGAYSKAGAAAWMRAMAPDLLPENDLAETPFAKV